MCLLLKRPIGLGLHRLLMSVSVSKMFRINHYNSSHSSALSEGVDIGLHNNPHPRYLQVQHKSKLLLKNKNIPDLEQLARHRKLLVPLNEVEEEWKNASGPYHIREIAKHFNIYKDLFDGAEFLSWVIMNIRYKGEEDSIIPVYWGNVVTPFETKESPSISYESNDDDWWTILLTNPDGNLHKPDTEVLHWLVTNVPGESVNNGQVIYDYLQPFPPKGTGYHRFVYVLFKQEGKFDLSEQMQLPCCNSHSRTFSTLEFYKRYQDIITPAGVNFFQCRWDRSVTTVFHRQLQMREPSFEYHPPPLYIAPQVKWPHKKPLKYLDRYRPQE
ncbi:large ribosomal subunit protein mL38-like [Antedon mediterranea]|uniref:large ribosomal subunit protein mL38-like n=1 Tax=Antedon mediterranea TaxID=105859 RepID=UPI003AF73F1B